MEAVVGEAGVAEGEGGLAQTRKAASLERSMRSGQRPVQMLQTHIEMLQYCLVIPIHERQNLDLEELPLLFIQCAWVQFITKGDC